MKVPQRPPSEEECRRPSASDAEMIAQVFGQVTSPTVNGRYIHWDKLRRLKPPSGLDHRSWWAGLKFHRRAGRKQIGLVDANGKPFSYALVDPLPEQLHHVDSEARGFIGTPIAGPNQRMRDQYVVRSLIEEAMTSSMLEGASTTRAVAKKMIREGRPPRDRSERMILNNYRTMERIRALKDQPLTPELVFEVQRMVTEATLDDPTGAGRLRRPQESIVIGDETGMVVHEPPPARTLADRIARMCDFANAPDSQGFVHPMIRSIILHFWLAYDHPFVDGNGRTARALFYWSMLRRGYWLFEFATISRIILRGPVQYGRAFLHTETDDNDLTYFLLYHADVIRRAVNDLHVYIDRKTREVDKAEAQLREMIGLNPRQRSLVYHALRHPGEAYTIEGHRSRHGTVPQTARTDLLDLVDRGYFRKSKIGRFWTFRAVDDLEDRLS